MATGLVRGSDSRAIFMITASGTPSTIPMTPQAQPQKATRRSSTIGDMSSLCPASCGSTTAPHACWLATRISIRIMAPVGSSTIKPRKIGGISDISAPT